MPRSFAGVEIAFPSANTVIIATSLPWVFHILASRAVCDGAKISTSAKKAWSSVYILNDAGLGQKKPRNPYSGLLLKKANNARNLIFNVYLMILYLFNPCLPPKTSLYAL
jgi:hypothetical protein